MNTKTLTITNVVLVIAVIILFVLQFSSKKEKNPLKVEEEKPMVVSEVIEEAEANEMPFKVAFINSDTLSKYSDYIIDITKELKTKQATAEYQFKKLVKEHQKAAESFKVNQAVMAQSEAERKYRELMENEQNIMQKEQELTQKYAQKEAQVMTDYVYETDEFMQKIGKDLGYDYIMSYRVGGAMLYANPELDVTQKVIDLLNEEYKKSKEPKQPSKEK